jgi:hypothetical protein
MPRIRTWSRRCRAQRCGVRASRQYYLRSQPFEALSRDELPQQRPGTVETALAKARLA